MVNDCLGCGTLYCTSIREEKDGPTLHNSCAKLDIHFSNFSCFDQCVSRSSVMKGTLYR